MAASARPATLDARLVAVERELAVLRQTVATVVAELRARKALPSAPPAGRRRVKMSPEARRAQRADLLSHARAKRWEATPKKTSKKSGRK